MKREEIMALQSFNTEGEYRESPSINYSKLKELENGPQCLVEERQYLTGEAIRIGSYVDMYFTDKEKLNDIFNINDRKIVLADTLNTLYESFLEDQNFDPSVEECLEKVKQLHLWDNIKDQEKIKSRLSMDLFDKLDQEKNNNGKVLLTNDEHYKAICSIANIEENDYAKKLISEGEDEIIIDQFKWEFPIPVGEERVVMAKIMVDKLKFDFKNKEIIGIDIKTGQNPSHRFYESFIEYRYDIQGILYLTGIMALKNKYFSDWAPVKPMNFKFLYSPKRSNSKPIIVSMSESFIRKNQVVLHNGKVPVAKGIETLLNDYMWYMDNQEFETHRLIAENNGVVTIDNLYEH